MKNLNIFAVLISALAILSVSPANAKNHEDKGKIKNATRDRAEQVADRAEKERADLSRSDEAMRDRVKDVDDNVDADDAGLNDIDMDGRDGRDKSDKRSDKAVMRGNEKAQEMRARRDERKEIMEEHKVKGSKGEHEPGADDDDLSLETDAETDASDKKGKKPWWKFWD